MKVIRASSSRAEFKVIAQSRSLQAAMMTLKPGSASDDEVRNEHPRSEQWLMVLSGQGAATVVPKGSKPRFVTLRPGTLLLIERGERHRIKNTGASDLRTINFYAPPAYDSAGEVLSE